MASGPPGTYSFNEYKTITCGDGGMIVTDDEALYERCFAMHDQGHAPDRLESKYAPRPFLGMNFRMTELSGAVLLAQVRKLDLITSHLRANKAIVKDILEEVPAIDYRTLTDPAGDLATHLVVVLPTKEIARNVAEEVGSKTLSESGWHTYSKMNHLLEKRTVTGKGCPFDCGDPGPLPRRLPGRHAAPDGRPARALDQHRDRRPRPQPGAVRAAHARRRGRGPELRPDLPGRRPQAPGVNRRTGR